MQTESEVPRFGTAALQEENRQCVGKRSTTFWESIDSGGFLQLQAMSLCLLATSFHDRSLQLQTSPSATGKVFGLAMRFVQWPRHAVE